MKREMALAWTLPLRSGGTLAIDIKVDLDTLTDSDREVVTQIVGAFQAYSVGQLDEETLREWLRAPA
jgi:hypothetical protein